MDTLLDKTLLNNLSENQMTPWKIWDLRISQSLPAVENPEHDVVSRLIAFGANDGMVGRGL